MDQFSKSIEDIKNLRIQGAANIAKEASKAFSVKAAEIKAKDKEHFLKESESIKKRIFSTRPTEPFMRNAVNYLIDSINDLDLKYMIPALHANLRKTLKWISKCERDIASTGAKRIGKGFVVYTHCHSSTVVDILKKAKDNRVDFEVHNTETRPRYQGRKTARELSSYNIPVKHYVDSAAKIALMKSDVMLIGADAITSEGEIINKVGSEMIAETAKRLDVPVYVCTHSWKFDPETIFGAEEMIEKRDASEVWPDRPKKVKIENFAFEKIDPSAITGIISELGIYRPQNFIEEVKNKYPWMFI